MTVATPEIANAIPEDDQFFEALELRRTKALVEREIQIVDRLHSADYQLITPSGKVFTKESYIAAISEAPFYSSWEIAELHCRIAGGMAAVRYQARLGFRSGRFISCWHIDLYEKRSNSWLAIWSQATEFSQT